MDVVEIESIHFCVSLKEVSVIRYVLPAALAAAQSEFRPLETNFGEKVHQSGLRAVIVEGENPRSTLRWILFVNNNKS